MKKSGLTSYACAILKLVEKFKGTTSVYSKSHLGWPLTAINEDASQNALPAFVMSFRKYL
jgi:hypothetical protein